MPNIYLAKSLISSAACIASSLVGHSTTACKCLFAGSTCCKSGIPNAAVLPVPVCACPIISFPSSITGIAAFWIGDIYSNPISETALNIFSSRPESSYLTFSSSTLTVFFSKSLLIKTPISI